MAIRTSVAIAMAAIVVAACASGEAIESSDLVVDVENSRTAQVRGVLYARLVNEGDRPLEVTSLQLVDQRFAEVPATPKSTTVAPGGDPVVTPFEYGEAVCGEDVSGPATLAVTIASGGEAGEQVLPVAPAGEEALTRLHESTCRQRAAAAAATIRFGPDWRATSPATARGRIVVERAATAAEVAVEQAEGTVIFSLRVLGGTADAVVVLAEDQDLAEVEVEVSAARCDPHALIESKKTYSFPIWVRVGEAEATYLVLEPAGEARAAMEQLLEVGCDLDH